MTPEQMEAHTRLEQKAKDRTTSMTEAQIRHMVNRFLAWRLPSNFCPDGGISFKAAFNENTASPMKHEPTGTNLFDVNQADAMVRYMIEGMPSMSIRPAPAPASRQTPPGAT